MADAPNRESFLRREAYIRYAGILLTLSPFGNFLWSVAYSGTHRWYRPHILAMFLRQVPAVLWLIWGLTFVAGMLMLKGKRSSWNFTLLILGVNIIFGIATFKADLHGGWVQPTMSLIINVSLFALVYVQEFHQRLERKFQAARAATLNRPFSLSVRFSLPLVFAGAPWAQIIEVTHAGIRVRSLDGEAPHQIEFRTVELALAPGLALRARYSAKIGADFVFRFVDLDTAKSAVLHRWARKMAARNPAPGPSRAQAA